MEGPPGWHPYDDAALRRAALRARRAERRRLRVAGGFLVVAALTHVIAVPVALLLVKLAADRAAGFEMSWLQFFTSLAGAHVLNSLILMVVGQFVFAFVAAVGAVKVPQAWYVAAAMVTAGTAAILYSILVLGGPTGAIAGAWSIAGGILGLPRAQPSFVLGTMAGGATPPWAGTATAGSPLEPAPSLQTTGRRPQRGTPPETLVLVAAAVVHILSIPFAVLVLMLMLQAQYPYLAGRSWGDIYALFGDRLGPTILFGAALQLFFAFVALLFAFLVRGGSHPLSAIPIVTGIAAVPLSLFVFGGIFGVAGGVLSLAGGVLAPRPPAA